jgi:hypothetical protein
MQEPHERFYAHYVLVASARTDCFLPIGALVQAAVVLKQQRQRDLLYILNTTLLLEVIKEQRHGRRVLLHRALAHAAALKVLAVLQEDKPKVLIYLFHNVNKDHDLQD